MARSSFIAKSLAGFSRLSGRERLLVGITALVLLVTLFAGGTFWVQSKLHKASRRLSERRSQLQQILRLQSSYEAAKKERKGDERRIKRNSVQLFSYLPKIADELGLTLNDLNERRTSLKDSNIDEISVDINLKKMSLDKLDAFLQRIEKGGRNGLVKVLKIKIKTRFDNPELLDVNMKVATYKPSSSS